ncbi:related to calpain-like protein [Cephalotrichum gorgonifer]|uniref:Related to calpain-like protein n=1 Tax=Cephalotrichum gorgonifer TaxID=2041049 RepID=A0AAE8MWS9_9PEZI|nr:related to calpain-like protein [Cephalotrichum gorgonifer]
MHGYSSSEESEDPKRPRPLPASTTTTDAKKRKKKKPTSQQAINRIWKKHQTRKPTTTLAVLPFDPVLPPAGPGRGNEASAAGYARAAEECSRKVKKIIKECRRVNMRYRDPGWDLDWDMKMEKGNCLNYLGGSTFDVSYPPLSSANLPKSVKRVHEIFEKPTFLETITSAEAIQGSLGNCWAIAALSALADVEDGIKRLCVEYDTRVGIYGFVFYRDGEWVYSIIDDKLYLTSPDWDSPSLQRQLLTQIDREDIEQHYRKTYQAGSKALFFGRNKDQNETWLPLLEKAYTKAHGDYASMIGGWIGECIEDLTGGVTTELLSSDILDIDAFWDDELSKVNKEFMFGCSTGLLDGGHGNRDGITEGHAYVIMDAKTLKSGQRLLKLRNPWGKLRKGVWEGAYADGSKEWTAEVQKELGHTFGSDSVFWIPYEDMLSKYQHLDRTRLFREDNWRCCQRWIGVDVPWKPDYHEKFHMRLTKDSPLVLVLSQLDKRYFKGLEGQYRFRLHFRVHQVGRPGAEDYIVRSHGNYLMTRSVSIEIPDMPAGEYTVFLLVTADRYTSRPSIEDVVKRECKARVANEKLAQVGLAYDLAHSKAHSHLEKVKEMRMVADREKASTSRKKERRKQWEKRSTDRSIKKKQKEKNEAKKARLQAERAAKQEEQKVEASSDSEENVEEVKSEEKASTEGQGKPADKPTESEQKTAEDRPTEDKPAEDKPSESGEKTGTDDKPADDKSDDAPAEDKSDDKSTEARPAQSVDKDAEPNKSKDALGNAQPSDLKIEEAKEAVTEKDNKSKPEAKPAASTEPSEPTSKGKDKDAKKASKASEKVAPSPPADAADYSSDSPVEDWEAIYSSDDFVRKPRLHPIPDVTADDRYPTDDEKLPDPWNAVCVVGFKVYSKDDDLELRVIMEGGALEEAGMGQKGERDLDNAQQNAAGVRAEKTEELAPYDPIVVKEEAVTTQTEDEDGDDESDGDNGVKAKRAKNKRVKVVEKTDLKGESIEDKKGYEATESKAQDEEVPEEEIPSDTTPEDNKKDEVSDSKPSDADLLKEKEEDMKKKEEFIKKWEEELKKKEEEIRKREADMKKRAEKVEKKEKQDDDEFVDCEESSSSSSGMDTPESTPSLEQKEILG